MVYYWNYIIYMKPFDTRHYLYSLPSMKMISVIT